MPESYSVVIITDSAEPDKLQRLYASISAQEWPEVEVILVRDEKREGHLGKLRNAGCRQAAGDILIVSDDDMVLHADFLPGLRKLGVQENTVYSCRIVNPDNTRYWDWKAFENHKNWLLDYGDTDPRVSITGGFCVMRKSVFERIQWDESRGFNEEEDVDWCNRLKAAGVKLEFNPWSTVTHDGPYTQVGIGVLKT
jgi:GT2 family glycosyltransferase